jgi:hypothetical protein
MNLRACIDACVLLIEEAPEALHFVLENLRRCFRALPKDLRAVSLLGTARSLIETEKNAGHVRTDIDVDLAAAVFPGTLAQIARMAHFGELKRKPSELALRFGSCSTRESENSMVTDLQVSSENH